MPRFVKDGHAVETAIPREAAQLRAEGFTEQKARTTEVKKADAEQAKTTTSTTK
ncbi:hypothetical protein SEA_ELESAR_16 [Arthrobacter phage Elesar]|uniref:Uncharacterized protein n=1 Tax=Arthrobacter phage Elesar TaxID=2510522 RepID=A0A411CQ63_9CAUD|nr:hypothetical protein QEO79_gp16 [Arthrobacter phage Elesar]QAY16068.1 hypothetical protein SEA_ELESAR_16 [Arthrobacter phage Elesar]